MTRDNAEAQSELPNLIDSGAPVQIAPKNQTASAKSERQEFFLPVTGFVWLYPEEVAIVNHPAFQRLGRINQLGQSYVAFRSATHKRFEHTLGVVHVANKMISSLQYNAEKVAQNGTGIRFSPLNLHEERFVRLGALLHDIGHVAAGHTLEDELGLIGLHDEDERLTLIFDKEDWHCADDVSLRSLENLINDEFAKYVPPKLHQKGISACDIARLLIRKPPSEGTDQFEQKQEALLHSADIRYYVCSNIIGNTICADLLDYIHRDWYHIGRPRAMDDRIFQYMEIRRRTDVEGMVEGDKPSPNDQFVIALGKDTKIRTDGVSAILGLLEWRYDLQEMVLFSRTKVAAGAMLDRALFELWEDKDKAELVEKILPLSDEQLLDYAILEADHSPARKKKGAENSKASAGRLLRKIRDRNLHGVLETYDLKRITKQKAEAVKKNFAGGRQGAENRAAAARLLESNFNLPAGSIALYCSQIKPKIAEVSISIDGTVLPFNEYEEKHDNLLSGGHLEAQIKRFERLWRLYFFIDKNVLKAMARERLHLVRQFVSRVVIADEGEDDLYLRVKELAIVYHQQEMENGNRRIEFLSEPPAAARNDPGTAGMSYPNGAPSLEHFLRVHSDAKKNGDDA